MLQEGVTRFGYRVHGFCLMRNHVHLALQVGEAPLTEVARRFNWDLSTLSRAVGALDRVATAGGAEAKLLRGNQNAIMQA